MARFNTKNIKKWPIHIQEEQTKDFNYQATQKNLQFRFQEAFSKNQTKMGIQIKIEAKKKKLRISKKARRSYKYKNH